MRKLICTIIPMSLVLITCLIVLGSDPGQATLGKDGSLPYLSGSNEAKIEKAWATSYPNRTAPKFDRNLRYYGTYDGYDILFLYTCTPLTDNQKREIGAFTFWYSRPFQLFAHKNGEFLILDDAYNTGLVSYETIMAVEEIHRIYNESIYELLYSE